MRLFFLVGHEFGERVVGNLVNLPNFCRSCDLRCSDCRIAYGSFAKDIVGIHNIPSGLPLFIDDPEEYLPKRIPSCDILMPIGVHPDILSVVPQLAERAHVGGVIVPIEDRTWCPPALKRKLKVELDAMGVDHAFPHPFCTLTENGMPKIDEFVCTYRVGRPQLEIDLVGDRVGVARVLRSAPCGSTWYVAEQLRLRKLEEVEQITSNAFHGYPCTASMEIDPELGDTIMHKAGYTIRSAVLEAVQQAVLRRKPPIEARLDQGKQP